MTTKTRKTTATRLGRPTPRSTTARRILGLVTLTVLLSACAPKPGQDLAAAIDNLGASEIDHTVFRENQLDPAEVYVWFAAGVTASDAVATWCESIQPLRDRVAPDVTVSLWLSNEAFVSTPDTCAKVSPSAT